MADGVRKIIHIDMDAFFASVEQRDNPRLRGRPVVVGGSPQGRGVVAAASYEARRFGVHSAMPCAQAYRLCPQAAFVKPRFDAYKTASGQIHAVFHEYTDQIEPLSLDEAYLDVSDNPAFSGSASRMARDIKTRIQAITGLTASAGVSYNKFLAKIASDIDKPDGLTVITPEQGPGFVAELPIGRFHGIGKVTEARMKEFGIHTGGDLLAWPLEQLEKWFGKAGVYYYLAARGVDERPVEARGQSKSIGSETTFETDLTDADEMLTHLLTLTAKVAERAAAGGLAGRTFTLKVKYADFRQVTRSVTLRAPTAEARQLADYLPMLLRRTDAGRKPVRLLGVALSNLEEPEADRPWVQLRLF